MMSDRPRQQRNGFRGVWAFLARRRGHKRLDITDVLTYLYLVAGVVVMFGPVLWLVMSSFKDESLLFEPHPTFLPYRQVTVDVEGYDKPLPVYDVTFKDVLFGGAAIVLSDVRADNGAVHGIDRVLVPAALADRWPGWVKQRMARSPRPPRRSRCQRAT